ncbi:hypothetical protein KAJ27_09255 [bacterium]|nr:hypothetical protein [bacterium]
MIIFLIRIFVRENVLKKSLFNSLEQDLKEKAVEMAQKEKNYLCDVMNDFSITLKFKNVKEISNEQELNTLFKQYLLEHEEYKNKIGVMFDSELHIKLFELKTETAALVRTSSIRFIKRKKIYWIIVKNIEILLNRPQDLARMKLDIILHFVKKGNYLKANEEINNLYQLAISTFPEKEVE